MSHMEHRVVEVVFENFPGVPEMQLLSPDVSLYLATGQFSHRVLLSRTLLNFPGTQYKQLDEPVVLLYDPESQNLQKLLESKPKPVE